MWSTDEELFQAARQALYSAVIRDAMDKLGFRNQFLPPVIVPLERSLIACGRAMTVLEADVFDEANEGSRNPLMANPFDLMMDALDDLKVNEVYTCPGGSPRYALWRELMSVRAMWSY
jgi:hypothetical protein